MAGSYADKMAKDKKFNEAPVRARQSVLLSQIESLDAFAETMESIIDGTHSKVKGFPKFLGPKSSVQKGMEAAIKAARQESMALLKLYRKVEVEEE